MTRHFVDVTEMGGQLVSMEQLGRTCDRYHWAAELVRGTDVLEIACGAGQGLGILHATARSLSAGDISPEVLAAARAVAAPDVRLEVFGAESLPFPDTSFDHVLLFEALYYVTDKARFVREAKRVLRPGGRLLIVTANKDLFDFNPSPYSQGYLGVEELTVLLGSNGFDPSFFASHDVGTVGLRQRAFRPVKYLAARLNLIPKSMAGKAWLKRLVFGRLVPMPAALDTVPHRLVMPEPVEAGRADTRHKVIYCVATLQGQDKSA
jgi:SAM-dependent methyltransferase